MIGLLTIQPHGFIVRWLFIIKILFKNKNMYISILRSINLTRVWTPTDRIKTSRLFWQKWVCRVIAWNDESRSLAKRRESIVGQIGCCWVRNIACKRLIKRHRPPTKHQRHTKSIDRYPIYRKHRKNTISQKYIYPHCRCHLTTHARSFFLVMPTGALG